MSYHGYNRHPIYFETGGIKLHQTIVVLYWLVLGFLIHKEGWGLTLRDSTVLAKLVLWISGTLVVNISSL